MHLIKLLKTERNLTTEKTVAEMNHYKEQIHTLDQNTRKPKKKKNNLHLHPAIQNMVFPQNIWTAETNDCLESASLSHLHFLTKGGRYITIYPSEKNPLRGSLITYH